MLSRVGRTLTLLGVCTGAMVMSACGSGPGSSATSTAAGTVAPATTASVKPSASELSTPAATTAPPATLEAFDPCRLLPVEQISAAIAGTWTVGRHGKDFCSYTSSRGAIFALGQVRESDLQAGLDEARRACDSTPREVTANGSFACVERADDGDVVNGNIVARQRLWLLTILAPGDGGHRAELAAMTALLKRIPSATV